jgi:hypothetical protein
MPTIASTNSPPIIVPNYIFQKTTRPHTLACRPPLCLNCSTLFFSKNNPSLNMSPHNIRLPHAPITPYSNYFTSASIHDFLHSFIRVARSGSAVFVDGSPLIRVRSHSFIRVLFVDGHSAVSTALSIHDFPHSFIRVARSGSAEFVDGYSALFVDGHPTAFVARSLLNIHGLPPQKNSAFRILPTANSQLPPDLSIHYNEPGPAHRP